MKNSPDNYTLAVFALIVANMIGGGAPLASKILLRELPPMTILFLRLTIMLVILMPLSLTRFRHLWIHRKQLVLLGLFWVGNLSLFIIGIKFTTAIASSIIYLGVPILVLFEERMMNKSKLLLWQVIGIGLGCTGALFVVLESLGTQSGFGTFHGNILLLLAIVSYSFYLTYSKRLSVHVSPLGLTVGALVSGWAVSLVFMVFFDGVTGLVHVPNLSIASWVSLLYVGIFLGVAMYFLNQWGIRHTSAVVAGAMLYVGTFTAWASGVLFLSEKITFLMIAGGALLVVGVFLTSMMPLLTLRKHSMKRG